MFFQETLIFFSSFRSWTSKGCNLKVSGLGQLKTPYHLGDLDFLGLRFLLLLRAKDLKVENMNSDTNLIRELNIPPKKPGMLLDFCEK